MSTTVLANDPQVTYNPQSNWRPSRAPSPQTSRWTGADGTNASLVFIGNEIDVFGQLFFHHSSDLLVNFTIDKDAPRSLRFHKDSDDPYRVLSFQQPLPSTDTHLLIITAVLDGGFFQLDSMVARNVSYPPSTTLSQLDPSAASSSGPQSSPTKSNLGSSNSAPGSEIASSSKVNVGGIVGGVIAVLVVLASLVAFLLYRRRRRMEAARRTTPFTVTPFVSEYSKHSSPGPEPFKTMPAIGTVPSLPFVPPPPIPPPDKKHDPPPAFVAGTSDLGRHGSMYKPRRSEESLPPTEYGYGVGMSRDEWVQYEAKLKS